jgi:hypothetical protein
MGNGHLCDLHKGHKGLHQITEAGQTFQWGPTIRSSRPPVPPHTASMTIAERIPRLESMLNQSREIMITQRHDNAVLRNKLERAIQIIRYMAEVYRSPVALEGMKELTETEPLQPQKKSKVTS